MDLCLVGGKDHSRTKLGKRQYATDSGLIDFLSLQLPIVHAFNTGGKERI